MDYAKKLNPGISMDSRTVRAVQGWVKVSLAVEAMKRADKAGKLNGPGIKDAFETMKEWQGLKEYGGQLVTITPTDHRYSSVVRIGRVIKGKPQTVAEVDMKAKFPESGPPGWAGNHRLEKETILEDAGYTDNILKLNNIEVMYHEIILVLKGFPSTFPAGIVALLGPMEPGIDHP